MKVKFETNVCKVTRSANSVERIILDDNIIKEIERKVQAKCVIKSINNKWFIHEDKVSVINIQCMPSDADYVSKLKSTLYPVLFTIEIEYFCMTEDGGHCTPDMTQEFFLLINI